VPPEIPEPVLGINFARDGERLHTLAATGSPASLWERRQALGGHGRAAGLQKLL
jgi:hypothetical protein